MENFVNTTAAPEISCGTVEKYTIQWVRRERKEGWKFGRVELESTTKARSQFTRDWYPAEWEDIPQDKGTRKIHSGSQVNRRLCACGPAT